MQTDADIRSLLHVFALFFPPGWVHVGSGWGRKWGKRKPPPLLLLRRLRGQRPRDRRTGVLLRSIHNNLTYFHFQRRRRRREEQKMNDTIFCAIIFGAFFATPTTTTTTRSLFQYSCSSFYFVVGNCVSIFRAKIISIILFTFACLLPTPPSSSPCLKQHALTRPTFIISSTTFLPLSVSRPCVRPWKGLCRAHRGHWHRNKLYAYNISKCLENNNDAS